MKVIYLPTLSFILFLSVLSSSCTDHKIPESGSMRVKSLTRILPDSPQIKTISLLRYDIQGRLASMFTYQSPDSALSQRETSSYFYNNDGSLVQMDRVLSGAGAERYIYTYDSAGHLSAIKYTGDAANYYDFSLTYDQIGQLSLTRRSFNYGGTVYFEELNSFAFSMGNLSRAVTSQTLSRNVPLAVSFSTDYIYDNNPNPFYGIVLIPAPSKIAMPTTGNFSLYTYYGGITNVFHLSKNNVVSSSIKGASQILYSYTYNSDGWPISRQTQIKLMLDRPAVLQETLLYAYEMN